MSIFSSIMNKIFSRAEAAPASAGGASTDAAQGGGNAQASSGGGAWKDPPGGSASASAGSVGTGSSAGQASAGGGAQGVDVEAVLSGMAAKNSQKLDWKRSIVDLMKLLDLDSSLSARKELAQELNYTGDMNDSAKMNMWLHKQVMQKLAENGGKVPESLRS